MREEELLISLLKDLEGHRWNNFEDRWDWKLEEGGKFSVKSSYKNLEDLLILEDKWSDGEKKVFGNTWKSMAPSKVVAFSWKLLLDRIPSKWNLKWRNVLPPDCSIRCVLCGTEDETSRHLFIHCDKVIKVREKVMRWMEISFITPPNLCVHWVVGVRGFGGVL